LYGSNEQNSHSHSSSGDFTDIGQSVYDAVSATVTQSSFGDSVDSVEGQGVVSYDRDGYQSIPSADVEIL
jgi:hypothetical protein